MSRASRLLFRVGNGGDDADGDGGNKGAGHIENGLGHHMNAPHGISSLLPDTGGQKPAHVDLAGKGGNELQSGGAHSDGNGDDQQPPGSIGIGQRGIPGLRQGVEMLLEAPEQVQAADKAADGNTQNGAAGGQRHAAG